MSNFAMKMTNKGIALQAKAQTGTQLQFTRVGVGDGSITNQQIPTMTALIGEKKSLAITKLKTQAGGKATVGFTLKNQDVTTGFYFREIGLFAQDPQEGEILYAYGNSGAGAEFISPGGGTDVIEKAVDIIALVGNASNVTATIDSSLVLVSNTDFQTHRTAAVLDHPDGSVTDAKIGNRTANPAQAPSGLVGTLTQWISWITNRIKAITGTNNWYDAPPTTLAGAATHMSSPTAHSAQSITLSSANFAATNVKAGMEELFTNVSNGKSNIAAAIAGKGVAGVSGSDTFSQLASKVSSIQLATGNALAGDVLAGKTFSNASTTGASGTMPNRGAVTITPGTTDQAITAGYHNGAGVVKGDGNLIPANITNGSSVFGVAGTAKRQATGTFNGVAGGGNVTINGLAFTPKYIYIEGKYLAGGGSYFNVHELIYNSDNAWSRNASRTYTWSVGATFTTNGQISVGGGGNARNDVTVNGTSFTAKSLDSAYTYTWYAWE